MTLKTQPVFYYGFEVTDECSWIDFKEGEFGAEISFQLDIGTYTSEELRAALEVGMNTAGTLLYTVLFDRFIRKYTVLSDDYFEFLLGTGTNRDSSLLNCLGFGSYPVWGEGHLYGDPHLFYGNVDSGLFTIHAANFPAGLAFDPQFCIQDFLDADDNEELRDASVQEATNGDIEIIHFGVNNLYEFNFQYITNKKLPCGAPIRNNPTGVEEANSFMKWNIQRKVIEYMPDKNDPSEYHKIRFERGSKGGRGGTGYRLTELFKRKLPEFFETGKLTFRRL